MFRFLFSMAIQAPAHIHLQSRPRFFHCTYVAVAGFTINPSPKMRLMTEVNKVWLDIYGDPGNRLAPFPIACQLLNRFIFSGDHQVTTHASFY